MNAAPAPAVLSAPAMRSGVTFGRVLRSEWIKVTTVRSTVSLLASTFVVMVGLGALVAWGAAQTAADPGMSASMGMEAGSAQRLAYEVPASGLPFGQLLIAALAVVVMASEYTSGVIRASMAAVPARTPVLLAKTLAIAAASLLVGILGALGSYVVAQPVLAAESLDYGLDAGGVTASIINTGTALALLAVMGVAIGALLRTTAGAAVTLLGALFVLPIIAELVGGLADWIPDAARFLPSNAGFQLVATTINDGQLTQVQGGLVLAAWAGALLAAAGLVVKKRDV